MKRINYKGSCIAIERANGTTTKYCVVKDGALFRTLEEAKAYIDMWQRFNEGR